MRNGTIAIALANSNSNDSGNDNGSAAPDESGPSDNIVNDEQPQRRSRKPRAARPASRQRDDDGDSNERGGLDLAVLPPAISVSSDNDADAKPARKPRAPRRPKADKTEDVATAAE